jgi:hypothetical protein
LTQINAEVSCNSDLVMVSASAAVLLDTLCRVKPAVYSGLHLRRPAVAISSVGNLSDANPELRVSFYFAAHQDDWQLFMNPSAFLDVIDPSTKTVFIHMTAGDAGLGAKCIGRKHPLYFAREQGAEAAIRFMADADNREPIEPSVAAPDFNSRPIRRVCYRNTVAYFLRLPDGRPAGIGYADTRHQSLRRLAEAQAGIAAIDETASYRDWNELAKTLRTIVEFERGRLRSIQINVPETDRVLNPDDHSDHLMTAKAALDAVEGLTSVRRVHYIGYASAALAENLTGEDRDIKCAVYAVTAAAVLAFDHPMSWRHYDRTFVGRNYFRVEEPSPDVPDYGREPSTELRN